LVLIAPYRDVSLALSWCQFDPASMLILAVVLPWCYFDFVLVLIVPCLGDVFEIALVPIRLCLGVYFGFWLCLGVIWLWRFFALFGFGAALVLVPPCLGAKCTLPWCWFRPALVLS
jgi:hypothetical protein